MLAHTHPVLYTLARVVLLNALLGAAAGAAIGFAALWLTVTL